LGKIGTPCCFVMPARIAATDPFKQINEYVGSGPMRFVKDEWGSGACAAATRRWSATCAYRRYLKTPDEKHFEIDDKRVADAPDMTASTCCAPTPP
jgi:hypothetical protein